MIVDGHIHLFRAYSAEYPRDTSDLFPESREALAEPFLATADACGVQRAVFVALSPEARYLRECVARYPQRLAGVAVHDPAAPEFGYAQALQWLTRQPYLRAVRLHWLGVRDARAATELSTYGLLKAMDECGLHLWFHSTPDQLRLLPLVAASFPRLKIILNHLGFCRDRIFPDDEPFRGVRRLPPDTMTHVLQLAKCDNVYVMLSGEYASSQTAFPFSDVSPVVNAIFDVFGPRRMFWASDYPFIDPDPGYARMMELPSLHLRRISTADLDEIMGGTALRLFPQT